MRFEIFFLPQVIGVLAGRALQQFWSQVMKQYSCLPGHHHLQEVNTRDMGEGRDTRTDSQNCSCMVPPGASSISWKSFTPQPCASPILPALESLMGGMSQLLELWASCSVISTGNISIAGAGGGNAIEAPEVNSQRKEDSYPLEVSNYPGWGLKRVKIVMEAPGSASTEAPCFPMERLEAENSGELSRQQGGVGCQTHTLVTLRQRCFHMLGDWTLPLQSPMLAVINGCLQQDIFLTPSLH